MYCVLDSENAEERMRSGAFNFIDLLAHFFDKVTLCCDKCGYPENGMDLTMYIPNGKEPQMVKPEDMLDKVWNIYIQSLKDDPIVRRGLADESYDEYAKYPHICKRCGESMHIVGRNEEMKCPECKTPMEDTGIGCWD